MRSYKIMNKLLLHLIFLTCPLLLFAETKYKWPVLEKAEIWSSFAKEKIKERNRYLSNDSKLNIAVLPKEEWPPYFEAVKPAIVIIEKNYLCIVLSAESKFSRSIIIYPEAYDFKEERKTYVIEEGRSSNVKRMSSPLKK